ncbi:MAG: hypothetical protein AB7S75_16540 [Desulfococcaceae bacterium]
MLNRIIEIGKRLDMGQILAGIRNKGMRFPLIYRFFSPVSGMLPDLCELILSLEGVMEKVEPQFLRIGMELQSLYADAERLSEITVDAAKSIGCTEGCESFLSRIDRLAKHSLSDLQGYRCKISSSLMNVSLSLEHLGRLCRICSVIEKTGISLNVIGLNIAAESSRSPDAGVMFGSFTGEIRQLSRKISGISRHILEDAGTTRKGQMAANAEILKGLETFGYLYSSAQRVVQKAIREIYSIMDLSMKVLEISNAHSRKISRQVGEVVVALQFHDIARQKIEHVVMAIRDAENICKGERDGDSPESALAQAHKLLRLQTVQLKEVISEILGAHGKSDMAFRELDRHVEQLVSDISVFETRQQTESRIEERIRALKTGLEQLGSLLTQGKGLEKQIKDTAEQVTNTASQLSEHIDQVRGISMDLHLKALNAVVKSARLAESGQVLEILAQEVSHLSRQSDKFVSDVVEILQSLVSLSLELDLGSFETPEQPEGISPLSVEDGIRELTENYEQFKMDTSAATEGAVNLREAMTNTGASLGFLRELAEDLTDYLEKLENLTGRLEPWNIHEKDTEAGRLEQVARRYTMKSERQLHRQYLGESSGRLFPANEGQPEDYPEDISGNHVPRDGQDKTGASGEENKTEDACPASPDMAADKQSGFSEKPGKNDEEEDLGDNVELF